MLLAAETSKSRQGHQLPASDAKQGWECCSQLSGTQPAMLACDLPYDPDSTTELAWRCSQDCQEVETGSVVSMMLCLIQALARAVHDEFPDRSTPFLAAKLQASPQGRNEPHLHILGLI